MSDIAPIETLDTLHAQIKANWVSWFENEKVNGSPSYEAAHQSLVSISDQAAAELDAIKFLTRNPSLLQLRASGCGFDLEHCLRHSIARHGYGTHYSFVVQNLIDLNEPILVKRVCEALELAIAVMAQTNNHQLSKSAREHLDAIIANGGFTSAEFRSLCSLLRNIKDQINVFANFYTKLRDDVAKKRMADLKNVVFDLIDLGGMSHMWFEKTLTQAPAGNPES